jgi:hypothetical protein
MIPYTLHLVRNGYNGEDNSIYQNSDTILTLTYPANLSGYTSKLQVRPTENSSTVLLELSSPSDGIVIAAGVTSTITMTFTHAKTNITPGIYTYALRITTAGTLLNSYLIKGNFEISASVVK